MILAIFQNERVYEGNEVFLNAVYPMPSLSKIVVARRRKWSPIDSRY